MGSRTTAVVDTKEEPKTSFRTYVRRAGAILPPRIAAILRTLNRFGRAGAGIPFGAVRLGDLRRTAPISENFGWDRGTPIDRYYIEAFLTKNANDVRGRVLEADDNQYTVRFGGIRVARSDVLSSDEGHPRATIFGDITQLEALPEDSFDCILLTQVLQYIYDSRAAISTLHRSLKRGGTLLITAPAISPMQYGWPWYWAFTELAVRRLLEERFGVGSVSVESHGNVFAAAAFLYGLAVEEIGIAHLTYDDPKFPVIVAARVTKDV